MAQREPDANDLLFHPRPIPERERLLGGYRLLHELGCGGMATLYLATDELGCLVAVKRLHPHLAAERRFVEMFQDEAAIAARITHPHVCKVVGLEERGGQIFIAMEYIHGESLAALLRQLEATGQKLPVEVALHLVGQACLGLHAAHEQLGDDGRPLQIVHRDISPHNLLVSYDGELKVVDFGIASAVARVHHTDTGTIKGKLSYMAPEQARGEPVDRRADIFCLGIVLYEALCGTRCFPGATPAETMRKVLAVELVPPRELRPELPPEVEAILARALAREPTRRYATAEAMYRDVYGALARAPGGVTTRGIGDLMRRVFAARFALREHLRSLAFGAPEVLQDEELTLEQVAPAAARCEYCGVALADAAALERHLPGCGQRAWWEHNFGGPGRAPGAGDARSLRERSARAVAEEEKRAGLWQRVRERLLPGKKRDPLVVRLESIETRLAAVRDPAASRLAGKGMAALWGIVSEIEEKGQSLLGRIKPKVLTCAEVVMGVTLEIEANASFLASANQERDLLQQIDALALREVAASGTIQKELGRSIRHKRALLAERRRIAERNELLLLRLESMVDAVELTLGRILQITSSPALLVELEANTQITVFLDSMLVEVKRLGEALREADEL